MLAIDLRSHRQAETLPGRVVFDRGVPDVIGYLRLTGLPVPAHVERAAGLFRYHPAVFIAPPWPGIFTQDRERRQDFAEAVRTHDAMVEAWQGCGYALVRLPLAPAEARVRFVTDRIGAG
jgi:predicted ATPase